MAVRPRLIPPQKERQAWPWHKPSWGSTNISAVFLGGRRLEAQNYLSGGFGLDLALKGLPGCAPLGGFASVHQPSRLKGIVVSPKFGTPYLAATQAFDLRPAPRKWLSIEQTESSEQYFVPAGTILVTRSGTVGDVTIAHSPHAGILISDDLLRLDVRDATLWGWTYAFLRTDQARTMMTGKQYGHVIKHLECSHLESLAFAVLRDDKRLRFNECVREIFAKRDRAHALTDEAERIFNNAVGDVKTAETADMGFMVPDSLFTAGRRRLEGFFHNPHAAAILARFKDLGRPIEALSEVTERVWWMSRFRRVFGDAGTPYLSTEDLFTLNPPTKKRVLVEQTENAGAFFVKAGWIAMACSGQVYGLNGSVALMSKRHEGAFLSHDVIRIIPSPHRVLPGYLVIALGHPTLGRPLVVRYAYGTSIPHLEPADLVTFPVIRLDSSIESEIAARAEEAAVMRSEADDLEDAITAQANAIMYRVLNGDTVDLQRCAS